MRQIVKQESKIDHYLGKSPTDTYKPPPMNRRALPSLKVIDRSREFLDFPEHFDCEVPTIPGLGVVLGVPMRVIAEWRALSNMEALEFNDICELIEDKAEHLMLNGALRKDISQQLSSLYLTSKRGYSKNVQLTGADRGPIRIAPDLTPEQAAEKYKEMLRG